MTNDSEKNSDAEVVFLNCFHFNSLSKHMKPLYADLILRENVPSEEKAQIVRSACSKFYRRIREYRNLTIDRVAELCRVSNHEVEALERGEKEHEKWLICRFIRACGADLEYEIFFQKLLEFKDPRARESVRDLAIPLLKRGLLIPGVDYKNLHSEKGKVVPLFERK